MCVRCACAFHFFPFVFTFSLQSEKKVEEEELRVTDRERLKGFVASGVEPRGIELVSDFYDNYKKIYDQEFKQNGLLKIFKRYPLSICKK